MNEDVMVAQGHALVQGLDQMGYKPRLAVWRRDTPGKSQWSLHLAPPKGQTDPSDFIRRVAQVVSDREEILGSFDVCDAVMLDEADALVRTLPSMIAVQGLGSIFIGEMALNGLHLKNIMILRSEH
jgi:hypothetical protein